VSVKGQISTYSGNTAVGLVGKETLAPSSALYRGGNSHDGSQDCETDHLDDCLSRDLRSVIERGAKIMQERLSDVWVCSDANRYGMLKRLYVGISHRHY
jgi:hypothetical protein